VKLTDEQKEKMSTKELVAWARRQLELDYPPEVVERIRRNSRAVAQRYFVVVGYCRQCNAEIHYFDQRVGTGDLCLDCFIKREESCAEG